MIARIAGAATLVLLAGCGSGKDVALENVSLENAAEQMRTEARLQPGQWQTTATIGSVSIPGAPPEVQQALANSVARTNTASDCITPEEAANPSAGTLTGGQGGDCRYESFRMSGGTMDAVMVCKPPNQQGQMRATLKGSYAPTDYTIDMVMNVSAPGMAPNQAMTMNAKVAGRRTGECAAGAN